MSAPESPADLTEQHIDQADIAIRAHRGHSNVYIQVDDKPWMPMTPEEARDWADSLEDRFDVDVVPQLREAADVAEGKDDRTNRESDDG